MSCSCSCCQNHNEHHHHHHVANKAMMRKRLIRLCIAVGLFVILFIVDKIVELSSVDIGLPCWILPLVCYFAVYLIQGWNILKEAGRGLINGYFLDENFLMAVASLGAFALGIYKGCIGQEPDGFEEGCAVVIFYSIGEFFQDWALGKSENTIIEMMDRHQINIDASDDTSKAENFITRFARIYTPVIVGLAIAIAIIPPGIGIITGTGMDVSLVNEGGSIFSGQLDLTWTTWIYRALSFLVLSCPCALVISIPLALSMGIGTAGKSGIFVMGSDCLEKIAASDTLTERKTGDADISVISSGNTGEEGRSDLALVKASGGGAVAAVKHIAERTLFIVRENIILTLGVKLAVLVLSAFGITNMWVAIFADEGIAMLAVLNAFRVAAVRKKN